MIKIKNQVNTDPMKSQLGYLEVVEPPSVVDSGTSEDQVKRRLRPGERHLVLQEVKEGRDVLLSCKAGGHPAPTITWRREDGKSIRQDQG